MPVKEKVEKILKDSLSIQELEILDESHLHQGHREAKNPAETHFSLYIVSSDFEGKSLTQRHRMVYAALREELKSKIHALSIKALTPRERD